MLYDYKTPAALFYSPRQLFQSKTSVLQLIADAHAKAFNFVCVPLTTSSWHERWKRSANKLSSEENLLQEANFSFGLDDVNITRLDEGESTIGVTSNWIELDSSDAQVRQQSEIAFIHETTYAAYLGLQTLILPAPQNSIFVGCYARSVNTALTTGISGSNMSFSVRIPLSNSVISAWEMWNTIRSTCDYNIRLSLTLHFDSPGAMCLPLMSRWISEPVRYLIISARCFISNTNGFPVLPKQAQNFIREIIAQRPTIILADIDLNLHEQGGDAAYLQYIRHLERTSPKLEAEKTEGTLEHFARGYQDYLQAPLQPLMDNLPSVTYETFERDPVKYAQYEKAVDCAVSDKLAAQDSVVICVVGAGRGGILARCFNVKQKTPNKVKLYAVEKNPNAFVTLQERNRDQWNGEVELIFGDMRSIELPEEIDILVSELLGSFGDNELSPECLDGAMRLLKPDGVSIPSQYTAYLTPLASSKLFCDTHINPKDEKSAETPYVVLFNAVSILSDDDKGSRKICNGRVQSCWSFEHPNSGIAFNAQGLPYSNNHNIRSAVLNFHIPHAGTLHGFGGYFETILYGDISLSIHPDTKDSKSPNMLSWFPLFFPLKEPLYMPSDSELRVSIWRQTNGKKVWYEWLAEGFLPIPTSLRASGAAKDTGEITLVKIGQTSLHNPNGRSSWIGL